ncbi:OmpA family protein [Candidatus Poribacteria bacterium]|nr:OmpA family protein [Candidatus Poribacteria bacterium]
MKRALYLMIALLVLALAVGGCGYLKKEEFNREFSAYKEQNAKDLAELKTNIGNVDQKLDNAVANLNQKIESAREEAIKAAEQGDADTMEKASKKIEEGDKAVRDEALKAARKAEENAKKYADAQVRKAMAKAADRMSRDINRAATAARVAVREIEEVKKTQKKIIERLTKEPIVVYFDSGKADLTDEAKAKLDKAIALIKKYPDAKLKIVGHADSRPVLGGKFRSNWDLSAARAKAVADYLKGKGITNEMEVYGRAHTEPISTETTKEGLAKNRRTEIWILPSL